MKTKAYRSTFNHPARSRVAVLIVALLAFGDHAVFARQQPTPTSTAEQDAPRIPNDQLDSLVAPIALYPDPLLSQVLVASTYPLEIVQLQQWLATKGNHMNEKAKTEAVQKQDWDPSIQAMAALPEVVKRLSDDIKWTSDLGNAFLAQQGDVMDAVQRMRGTAQSKGTLKSNEQMKVETKVVESKTIVVIEQANPEVVYVPSYSPTVVWGAMPYPYPPIYYPPAGYYAGAAIGFGVGIAIGAAWGGGGWGWGCGWGGNDVNVNVNNSFNRNTNISGGNRTNISGNRPGGGNNKWQHNPQHRGGAPYSNRATATKYGGSARGDSMASRQATARQNSGQPGGGGRQQAGNMDRGSGGRQQAGSMDRGGGDRGSGGRAQSGSMDRGGDRGSGGFSGGGGDHIGSREVSRGSSGGNRSSGSFGGNSSFGGGSMGGSSARSSSSRGSSSMGSRGGGGGMSRGGGGGRGGGGRRR